MLTIKKMLNALAVTSCGLVLALGSAGDQLMVTQVEEDADKNLSADVSERKAASEVAVADKAVTDEAVKSEDTGNKSTVSDKTEQPKDTDADIVTGGVAAAGASAVSIVNVSEAAAKAEKEHAEDDALDGNAVSDKKETAGADEGLTYEEMKKIVVGDAGLSNDTKESDDSKSEDKKKSDSDGESDSVKSGDVSKVEEFSDDSGDASEEGEEAEVDTKKEFGYEHLGVIDIDGYVNIRKEKNPEAEIVGQLQPNSACEILDVESEWIHIKSGDIEGYIRTAYLLTGKEAVEAAGKVVNKTAKVTADILNVRSDGSIESDVLSTVRENDELQVDADLLANANEGWIPITYEGNKKGYVSADFVEVTNSLPTAVTPDKAVTTNETQQPLLSNPAGTEIATIAQTYVGGPYVWGGESLTNGCDCSGFVMKLYENYGINLPHSSLAQSEYGMPVDPNQAQPGDLVFYDHGKGTINHVAMCIGNGRIVHASNSRDGIITSDLFYSNPVCVKRLM